MTAPSCFVTVISYRPVRFERQQLRGRGGEAIAFAPGSEEIDGGARGHGDGVVRVAGERERAIRKREDEAAVADVVAVHHVRPHEHGGARESRAHFDDLDAEASGGGVFFEHCANCALSELLGGDVRGSAGSHGLFCSSSSTGRIHARLSRMGTLGLYSALIQRL